MFLKVLASFPMEQTYLKKWLRSVVLIQTRPALMTSTTHSEEEVAAILEDWQCEPGFCQ
jgi:hypothetical protein